MTVAVLVMTDGRDSYLERTLGSLHANVRGPITEMWMHDDTGDDEYRARLAERHPDFRHINGGPRRGFGGAIVSAWECLLEFSHADHVFHCESDFTFNRHIDLRAMVDVLETNPRLAQMALLRQPWNDTEKAASGVLNVCPGAFTEEGGAGREWLRHTAWFTTNPSVYRRTLCAEGWPHGEQSEGVFTRRLLDRHPDWCFGYWGARDSGAWVHHIGDERAPEATGY